MFSLHLVERCWAQDGSCDELFVMSVSELRRKLPEVGLDVDGSREAMIEALQAVDEDSTGNADDSDDD